MNIKHLLLLAAAMFLLSACQSSPAIQYGDATAVETTSMGFGSTDLQTIATKLVDDMLVFPPIVQETSKRRPVVFVERIKNKTTEHIDTESITDSIQTKLIQSGKFRFVDMTAVKQVQAQFNYQLKSGMVDPSKASAFGRQIGAQYMLYGNMSSIVKRNKKSQDVYYKFSLKLLNIETGIMEWMGEKEIRKVGTRGFIAM